MSEIYDQQQKTINEINTHKHEEIESDVYKPKNGEIKRDINLQGDNFAKISKQGENPSDLDFSEMKDTFIESLPISMRSMSPGGIKAYYDILNDRKNAFSKENMQFYKDEQQNWIEKFKGRIDIGRHVKERKDKEDYFQSMNLSELIEELKGHWNFFAGDQYKAFKEAAIAFEAYTKDQEKIDMATYSEHFNRTMTALNDYIQSHGNAKSLWGKKRLKMAKSIRAKIEYSMNPITFFAGQFKEYDASIKMAKRKSFDDNDKDGITAPDYVDIVRNESTLTKVVSDNIGENVDLNKILEKRSVIDAVLESTNIEEHQVETVGTLCNEIKNASEEDLKEGFVMNDQVKKSVVLGVLNGKLKKAKDQIGNIDKLKRELQEAHDEKLEKLRSISNVAKSEYEEKEKAIKTIQGKIDEIKESDGYKGNKISQEGYINERKIDLKKYEDKKQELNKEIEKIKDENSSYSKKISALTDENSDYNIQLKSLESISKGQFNASKDGQEINLLELNNDELNKIIPSFSYSLDVRQRDYKISDYIESINTRQAFIKSSNEKLLKLDKQIEEKRQERETASKQKHDQEYFKTREPEYDKLKSQLKNENTVEHNVTAWNNQYKLQTMTLLEEILKDKQTKALLKEYDSAIRSKTREKAKTEFTNYFDKKVAEVLPALQAMSKSFQEKIVNHNIKTEKFNDALVGKAKRLLNGKEKVDSFDLNKMSPISGDLLKFEPFPFAEQILDKNSRKSLDKEAKDVIKESIEKPEIYREKSIEKYEGLLENLNDDKYDFFNFKGVVDSTDVTAVIDEDLKNLEWQKSDLQKDIKEFEEGIKTALQKIEESKAEQIDAKKKELLSYCEKEAFRVKQAFDEEVNKAKREQEKAIEEIQLKAKENEQEINAINEIIKTFNERIENYGDLKKLNEDLQNANEESEIARKNYAEKEVEVSQFEKTDKSMVLVDEALKNKEKYTTEIKGMEILNDALAIFFKSTESLSIKGDDEDMQFDDYNYYVDKSVYALDNESMFKEMLTGFIEGYAVSLANTNIDKYKIFLDMDESVIESFVNEAWNIYSKLGDLSWSAEGNDILNTGFYM